MIAIREYKRISTNSILHEIKYVRAKKLIAIKVVQLLTLAHACRALWRATICSLTGETDKRERKECENGIK